MRLGRKFEPCIAHRVFSRLAASAFPSFHQPEQIVTASDPVPTGTSCQVAVAFGRPGESSGYGYVLLQAYGNTRQQNPARVTLVLPPPADN